MRMKEKFRVLYEELKKPKPGLKAQLRMITTPRPGDRPFPEAEESSIKAGVLILLYPYGEKLHFVLTRRTQRVNFHQAQISFPGGRQEPNESLVEAALREAYEELKIPWESVHILGTLTPLYIPPSNYCIYPVVGAMDKRPGFEPSSFEVAEVIEVPLDYILNPENVKRERWYYKGNEIEVPFFDYKGHKIWGATAMVLAEFIEVTKRANLFNFRTTS